MYNHPSGTVTFLFTDIEGSTKLWQEQPEAMGIAHARHDEILRNAIKPQWGTSSTLSDGPLMLQITKGLWAGMIHSFFGELPDSNHPLMVKYRAWHQKYEPGERWGVFYWAGMAFAEPLVEGLQRAGKNVTPESFIKAMETLKDWRGTGTPLTFTPTDHQGSKQVYFLQVPDGTFKKS